MTNHIPLTSLFQAYYLNAWNRLPFDLLSVRKKETRMLSYESKFSRHMRNMGNAAEYFMFFKWKSKILVCLCIFYKKENWGKK